MQYRQPSPLYRWGMFLARHKRRAIVVWAVLLAIALPIAPRVVGALAPGGFSSPSMESQRVGEIIASRFGHFPSSLVVVFTSADIPNRDPRFLAAVDATLAEVRALDVVASVTTPRDNPAQLSADGTTAYALIGLRPAAEEFRTVLPRIQAALRPSELEHIVTGAPVFYDDIQAVTERDLRRAEAVSLPLAAFALLMVFGTAVAALLPALVGGVSVLITLATMALLSEVTFISVFSLNMVTMLGLGLGIDYALFIVSRFREELRSELRRAGSNGAGAGDRGPVGPVLGGDRFRRSPRPHRISLSGAEVAGHRGSARRRGLGRRGPRPAPLASAVRRPWHRPLARATPDRPWAAWGRIADNVMAHPVRVLVPVLAILLVLGYPFFSATLGAPDASILPQDVPSRRGSDLLRDKFSEGELTPAVVLLSADGSMLTPARVGAIYDFIQDVARQPGVGRVDSAFSLDPRLTREQYQLLYARPDHVPDPFAEATVQQTMRDGVMLLRVVGPRGQTAEEARSLVRQLRSLTPPPGMGMLVGGSAAGALDYVDGLSEQFPRAILFICVTSFFLLFILFGSVILPMKAIAMNALSITASFGALVVVFQDGFLSTQLGFQPLGYVEASLPILLFCVLFGLSMDYEVFLLSRVKEAYQKTGDNRLAVAEGLQQSGAVITSAAAIIVLVAGSFVAADIILIKALGFGTAIAVLIDATLVRALLVPATMRLLGRWNWWAPAPLRRLVPWWELPA